MPASSTMTIRVTREIKEKLGRLAHETRRSKSYLAAEAVSAYVARELEITRAFSKASPMQKPARVIPHSEAMAEIYAAIDAAKGGKV